MKFSFLPKLDVKKILGIFGLNGAKVYEMLTKTLVEEMQKRFVSFPDERKFGVFITLYTDGNGELMANFNYLLKDPFFVRMIERHVLNEVVNGVIAKANEDFVTRQLIKAVETNVSLEDLKAVVLSNIGEALASGGGIGGNCLMLSQAPNGGILSKLATMENGLVVSTGQDIDISEFFNKF